MGVKLQGIYNLHFSNNVVYFGNCMKQPNH